MKSLVVDDDFITQQTLAHLLEEHGACDTASNGKEAMELFMKASKEGKPYDLVTMDMEMPDMNGLEALKMIRQVEELRGIPLATGSKVIMVTAHESAKDVLPAFKAGCEAYIVKPISEEKVLSNLKKFELIG